MDLVNVLVFILLLQWSSCGWVGGWGGGGGGGSPKHKFKAWPRSKALIELQELIDLTMSWIETCFSHCHTLHDLCGTLPI